MTLPTEYDKSDGWDSHSAIEMCPHCGVTYSANGGHVGPVFDQNGREFETHLDTDPNKGPYFCADCWPELEKNRKQNENQSLSEFA